MNLCMGGVQPAWPGGGDMDGWLARLLVELLVEGTICKLAFYYVGLLHRIYTEWPDYYAFRDHNNLATQFMYLIYLCDNVCYI